MTIPHTLDTIKSLSEPIKLTEQLSYLDTPGIIDIRSPNKEERNIFVHMTCMLQETIRDVPSK